MDDVIATARARFSTCYDQYSPEWALARDDMRFRLGQQWPDAVIAARGKDRVALVSNQCTRFIRQVTGDARKNDIAINVLPIGSGADIETARVLKGMVRHVERRSNAAAAYDNAIDHSATIGMGYVRVSSRYTRPNSFDQELVIDRVVDPFSVYLDPSAVQPCGEDAKYAFISTTMLNEEFEREYPGATVSVGQFGGIGCDDTILWRNGNMVTVCEYYEVVETPAKLLMFEDGSIAWASDLDKVRKRLAQMAGYNVEPIRERMSSKRKVIWRKISGAEVLDETDVPGRYGYIPVVPVYGEEIYFEGMWHRSGLIRQLKDPGRLRNYALSIAAETVALSPKAPFVGAEGQFDGHEAEWASAHMQNFAYLEYRPTSHEGNLVPAPSRATPPIISQGALELLNISEHDMMGAVGIYQASLGQRSNETSGRAILARQREGDTGTYVYHDQLATAIRHIGKILLDQIPIIYDVERIVQIVGDDDETADVKINGPTMPIGAKGAAEAVIYDVTEGEYSATVDVGPAYASRREEALDRLMTLIQSVPAVGQVAPDIVAGLLDVDGVDRLVRRLKAVVPPAAIQAEEQPKQDDQQQPQQPPIPPQVVSAIKAMEDDINKLQAENQQLRQQLDVKDQDNATKIAVAKIGADASRDVAAIREGGAAHRDMMERMHNQMMDATNG